MQEFSGDMSTFALEERNSVTFDERLSIMRETPVITVRKGGFQIRSPRLREAEIINTADLLAQNSNTTAEMKTSTGFKAALAAIKTNSPQQPDSHSLRLNKNPSSSEVLYKISSPGSTTTAVNHSSSEKKKMKVSAQKQQS